jgi:hypothetical protein
MPGITKDEHKYPRFTETTLSSVVELADVAEVDLGDLAWFRINGDGDVLWLWTALSLEAVTEAFDGRQAARKLFVL